MVSGGLTDNYSGQPLWEKDNHDVPLKPCLIPCFTVCYPDTGILYKGG